MTVLEYLRFYPRHPRGWRRPATSGPPAVLVGFLSTPPSRVATRYYNLSGPGKRVSIHATLAGGDKRSRRCLFVQVAFLSTPPSRVATRGEILCCFLLVQFLSTPPSRVATWAAGGQAVSAQCFYPRHPRGWRPCGGGAGIVTVEMFLSTPPSRVATARAFWEAERILFLSTPPSRVATRGSRPLFE